MTSLDGLYSTRRSLACLSPPCSRRTVAFASASTKNRSSCLPLRPPSSGTRWVAFRIANDDKGSSRASRKTLS